MAEFKGFKKPAMDFLRDLSSNNNREWFRANKERYDREIYEPSQAFIEAMSIALDDIAPHFLALPGKQGGSLMRVYRDTRFAKHKAPLKTNIGIQFRHEDGSDVHAPGFYVHIQQPRTVGEYGTTTSLLAAGIWGPPSKALLAIRQRIAERPREWRAARDAKAFTKSFTLQGESLSRAPRGFNPDHECIEDLKRKHFVGYMPLSQRQVASPSLVEHAAHAFADAEPLMRFLCAAVGAKF